MYHPTTRVLTVLELLQVYDKLSGQELARRLEVDPRTIRHYVTLLQDLGIPVEAERGRHGGYRLRPGYKLPPLMFNEEEALALSLGLLLAQQVGLSHTKIAVEGALAKLERVMPDTLRDRVQSLHSSLSLGEHMSSNLPTSELLFSLSSAIHQRKRISIGYRNIAKQDSQRDLDPYGVVLHQGRWYCVGFCQLRHELRLFRLDRIQHINHTKQQFERPEQFDIVGFVMRSLANTPADWEVEILLHTDLQSAQERIPADLAIIEERSNGLHMTCRIHDLNWLARFLAGLHFPITILQPPELRTALKEHAEYLLAQVMQEPHTAL
jgi:predicted DNA-binding transcriptional regulator YafY